MHVLMDEVEVGVDVEYPVLVVSFSCFPLVLTRFQFPGVPCGLACSFF
jgi:hypothetical protein